MSLDNDEHLETVVFLSHKKADIDSNADVDSDKGQAQGSAW